MKNIIGIGEEEVECLGVRVELRAILVRPTWNHHALSVGLHLPGEDDRKMIPAKIRADTVWDIHVRIHAIELERRTKGACLPRRSIHQSTGIVIARRVIRTGASSLVELPIG
jgi:hypothetical protein